MALGAHFVAVLFQLVERRIENHDPAALFKASPGFPERRVIVGGIVERRIEYDEIELPILEWESIEFRFHDRKHTVVPRRSKPVERIRKDVDRDRPVSPLR